MTKKEKELIKKAIRHIHHDDDYFTGMNILAKLVGWKTYELPEETIPLDAVEYILNGRDKNRFAYVSDYRDAQTIQKAEG